MLHISKLKIKRVLVTGLAGLTGAGLVAAGSAPAASLPSRLIIHESQHALCTTEHAIQYVQFDQSDTDGCTGPLVQTTIESITPRLANTPILILINPTITRQHGMQTTFASRQPVWLQGTTRMPLRVTVTHGHLARVATIPTMRNLEHFHSAMREVRVQGSQRFVLAGTSQQSLVAQAPWTPQSPHQATLHWPDLPQVDQGVSSYAALLWYPGSTSHEQIRVQWGSRTIARMSVSTALAVSSAWHMHVTGDVRGVPTIGASFSVAGASTLGAARRVVQTDHAHGLIRWNGTGLHTQAPLTLAGALRAWPDFHSRAQLTVTDHYTAMGGPQHPHSPFPPPPAAVSDSLQGQVNPSRGLVLRATRQSVHKKHVIGTALLVSTTAHRTLQVSAPTPTRAGRWVPVHMDLRYHTAAWADQTVALSLPQAPPHVHLKADQVTTNTAGAAADAVWLPAGSQGTVTVRATGPHHLIAQVAIRIATRSWWWLLLILAALLGLGTGYGVHRRRRARRNTSGEPTTE